LILTIDAVNGFVDNLLQLGTDVSILTEAVHASSQTIDSRHFADEFVRRRKLADKGISVETPAVPSIASNLGAKPSAANNGNVSSASGSGWNDVAKSKPVLQDNGGLDSFKVVAPKRKGGKR
jgi:PERQ amino acid-rich with GYF domain-containing protein